jgi:hypothetical protein
MTVDDKWWRFGIQLSNLNVKNCKDDSLLIADAAGVAVRGVKAENRRIRILHARDCILDGIDLKNGELIVEGQPKRSPMQTARPLNLELRNFHIDSGYVDIHNCRDLTCTGIQITHPTSGGFRTSDIFNSRLNGISVADPVTSATRATAPSH